MVKQVVGDDHRAVLAARAADRHREMVRAFLDVFRKRIVGESQQALQELLGLRLLHDIVIDALVVARIRPQVDDPVRIGQETDVDHQIGIQRHAVLVAEADEAD